MASKAYGRDPSRYMVMVDYKPKQGKSGDPYTNVLGWSGTLEGIKRVIEKHEKDMNKPSTYGGLIDWGDDEWVRTYRIFEITANRVLS